MTIQAKHRHPVFEGEETPPAGDPAPEAPPAGDPTPEPTPNGKSFTQEDVNRLLAQEKRKHKQTAEKAIEEAKALRTKAQLTAEERDELDKRIGLLQDELLTKEELAKKNEEELRKQHEEHVTNLTVERDRWQQRFTDSTIKRSITDAAATHTAYNPTQIVAILGPNTRLVDVLDENGQPTGELTPKVKFQDVDKEGKAVTLDLPPKEAVKRMKGMDQYLNLFKIEGSGGAGLSSQPAGKRPDLKSIARDPAAYREARKRGELDLSR